MRVEVVHALPEGEEAVTLTLPAGATVADALAVCGIAGREHCKVGIYGKVVPASTRLADGDRVELYRPLEIDPKEARRRRARKKTT